MNSRRGYKSPNGECAERLHFHRYGEEPAAFGGDMPKTAHVLDDGNVAAEECRMNWALAGVGIVDVERIDADDRDARVHEPLGGAFSKMRMSLEIVVRA